MPRKRLPAPRNGSTRVEAPAREFVDFACGLALTNACNGSLDCESADILCRFLAFDAVKIEKWNTG